MSITEAIASQRTNEASHYAANGGRDTEEVGDGRCIQKLVLW